MMAWNLDKTCLSLIFLGDQVQTEMETDFEPRGALTQKKRQTAQPLERVSQLLILLTNTATEEAELTSLQQ